MILVVLFLCVPFISKVGKFSVCLNVHVMQTLYIQIDFFYFDTGRFIFDVVYTKAKIKGVDKNNKKHQ